MLAISVLLSIASLASASLVPRVTPDNDPFYQPPSGFESSAPGTVFKNRASKSTLLGVTATQILYRTNDAKGRAIATVATILKNANSSPSKLVAYQDYEDAANNTCSPSYGFTTGNAGPFEAEFGPEIPNGLANGWTIVVPDYEGFKSSFAAGRLEGHATLDAIRAVLNYAPAGVKPDANIGLYGYSGGALATGWAATLSNTYAPELNIKGFAFGGTPSNVTSTLQKVDGTLFAGFGAGGTAGLISAYEELQTLYNRLATPTGKASITKVSQQCAIDDLFGFAFQSILSTTYQSEGPRLLYDPTVVSVLVQNTMGTVAAEHPVAPALVYHSTADEVIPYESANKTVHAWCANGANIDFRTDTSGAGHAGLLLAYSKTATDWLAQRMNNVPLTTSGCTFSNIQTGGLPLVVGGQKTSASVESELGSGDSKLIAQVTADLKAGKKPSFFSLVNKLAAAGITVDSE